MVVMELGGYGKSALAWGFDDDNFSLNYISYLSHSY